MSTLLAFWGFAWPWLLVLCGSELLHWLIERYGWDKPPEGGE